MNFEYWEYDSWDLGKTYDHTLASRCHAGGRWVQNSRAASMVLTSVWKAVSLADEGSGFATLNSRLYDNMPFLMRSALQKQILCSIPKSSHLYHQTLIDSRVESAAPPKSGPVRLSAGHTSIRTSTTVHKMCSTSTFQLSSSSTSSRPQYLPILLFFFFLWLQPQNADLSASHSLVICMELSTRLMIRSETTGKAKERDL